MNITGTDMNYSACSSLVNMLNFDTEGKADCMKIIINSTKGFQQFYSNGTLFEDIWFSGAKKWMRPLHRY